MFTICLNCLQYVYNMRTKCILHDYRLYVCLMLFARERRNGCGTLKLVCVYLTISFAHIWPFSISQGKPFSKSKTTLGEYVSNCFRGCTYVYIRTYIDMHIHICILRHFTYVLCPNSEDRGLKLTAFYLNMSELLFEGTRTDKNEISQKNRRQYENVQAKSLFKSS